MRTLMLLCAAMLPACATTIGVSGSGYFERSHPDFPIMGIVLSGENFSLRYDTGDSGHPTGDVGAWLGGNTRFQRSRGSARHEDILTERFSWSLNGAVTLYDQAWEPLRTVQIAGVYVPLVFTDYGPGSWRQTFRVDAPAVSDTPPNDTPNSTETPEPGTLMVVGSVLGCCGLRRRA